MGDEHVQRAVLVKHDPVGARRAARVDGVARQDRELVPGRRGGEGEALVVVVLVGVAVCCRGWSVLVLWFADLNWDFVGEKKETRKEMGGGGKGDAEKGKLTDGASGLLQRVALVEGRRDVRLCVADAAASVRTGARLGLDFGFGGEGRGRDGGGEEEGEEGGDELELLVLC